MNFNEYVATGEQSFYYNHSMMLEDVKKGMRIIENTNFQAYENQRMQALKKFAIGNIINDNGMLARITGIDKDTIIAIPLSWYTKSGKLKKQYVNNGGYFFNPCHVELVKEAI